VSDPVGGKEIKSITLRDPRWSASEDWVKMAKNIDGVEIHYVRNVKTGEVDDFEFKY
jgi:hypothetical protein